MQRIDPRPTEAAPQSQSPEQNGQQNIGHGSERRSYLPSGFASTGRDSHTQSFEEIYGVPENFLEIEVWSAGALTGMKYAMLTILLGDRSTNTPTYSLSFLQIYHILDPAQHEHTRIQAQEVRGATTIL